VPSFTQLSKLSNNQNLSNMGFLNPTTNKKTRGTSGPAISVNGDHIRFSKETANALGLKDHVNVYLGEEADGEQNRMYFLTNVSDASQFKLNGKEGKPRGLRDANIVTVARIGSDTYPLKQSTTGKTKGWYLEYDPKNPVPSLERTKRVRKEGDPGKATNKAIAGEIEKKRSTASSPAAASKTATPNRR
jgi:hypothetical protein